MNPRVGYLKRWTKLTNLYLGWQLFNEKTLIYDSTLLTLAQEVTGSLRPIVSGFKMNPYNYGKLIFNKSVKITQWGKAKSLKNSDGAKMDFHI